MIDESIEEVRLSWRRSFAIKFNVGAPVNLSYGKRNKDSVYTRIIYYCINNIIAYQLATLVKGVVHCIVTYGIFRPFFG